MVIYCTTLHIQHTRVTMVEGMKLPSWDHRMGVFSKKMGRWDHKTLSMIAPFPLWNWHTSIHHSQWSRSKMGLLNFSTIQCCSHNSTFIQLLDILVYFPIEFGVYQQTIGSYSDSCFCNQWYLAWDVQNGTSTKPCLFLVTCLPGHAQKSSRLSSVSLAKNMRLRKKRTATWVSQDFKTRLPFHFPSGNLIWQ